ncbi:DUF7544 domain-containing protein [Streptomyces millisiae]|uniref:Glycerophosphoryl diester phosphodiesterase membrane domain-containing protein n=1 Tax=Streptomyces millisiae TaxID=3075542 RepID=A0ABU2M054_9ACTN|nr:hypothetical protein [Streptomyces sp. DSM 44918]MDT0323227.1 hypothetical protein [Streptomyces sp. DSM 44918]
MSESQGWTPPGSPKDGEGHDANQPTAPQTPPAQPAPPTPPQGWGAAPPPQQPGWGHPPGWGQQQGWGQQPGWGAPGGWQPQPQAPKPGVIPLRPLGVGEILDGAVSTARAHWRTVLAIALPIAIVIQLLSSIALHTWLSDSSGFSALENNPNPTDEELRDAFGDLLGFGSVTGIATLLGNVLATAMLTIVVSRAVLGRGVTVGEAWHDSRGRLLRLLGLVLLVPLISVVALLVPVLLLGLGGSPLLAALGFIGGVVLAVWLWTQFSLAAPALMLERQGSLAAMRRSWKLVTGSWWRVFGIQLLILVLLTIVSGIIEFPTTLVAEVVAGGGSGFLEGGLTEMSWSYLAISGVGAVIASGITLPISAGVTALLYIDQRIRREALDIELASAAGLGDTPAPGN